MNSSIRQRVDLRWIVRTLADDPDAIVYVADDHDLWTIAAVERGGFILSDCSQPCGKRAREISVSAVELALGFDLIVPKRESAI